ncbi:MAG: acyl--CoA ligase [Erysipelotrichaceae bacterium]|nr:acyl--CoA ligase [Erysipelotrichaceae bacterium]
MIVNNKSIAYLLYQNQERNPDKAAIINNGKTVSYKQLWDLVEKDIRILQKRNIQKNDLIGVQLFDSIEFCALMYASASLGSAIAPIDKSTPKALAEKRFSDLGVKTVITDEDLKEELSTEIIYPELDGDETMIISLTSGSTNEPKAIELTQNNKIIRAKAHIDLYHLNEDDVILTSTPLFHSLAERLVNMALILGGTVVIIDEFKPYEWFNIVHRDKVTFTITDSSQLAQISQMLLSPFIPEITSLKAIVSSSSFLENHVKKELINKLNCDLYEIYGTSETSTLTNIDLKQSDNFRSVGKPLQGVELKISDPDEKNIGEILCKTDLIFKGYYNSKELTEDAYRDGYFKTGDLGRIDEDGYLYYCGRKDELIKSNGINIYPFDIEDVLNKLDEIKECAIFSYPDDIKGNVIGLAAVLNENAELSKEEISKYCTESLPELSRPEYIFIMPELPKNSLGKIRKNKIYENIIRNQMMGETY